MSIAELIIQLKNDFDKVYEAGCGQGMNISYSERIEPNLESLKNRLDGIIKKASDIIEQE